MTEIRNIDPGCVEDAPIAKKKLEVECPFCGTTLVISMTGRLIETRRPKKPTVEMPWDTLPDEGW